MVDLLTQKLAKLGMLLQLANIEHQEILMFLEDLKVKSFEAQQKKMDNLVDP
jgi:hypothetical protein